MLSGPRSIAVAVVGVIVIVSAVALVQRSKSSEPVSGPGALGSSTSAATTLDGSPLSAGSSLSSTSTAVPGQLPNDPTQPGQTPIGPSTPTSERPTTTTRVIPISVGVSPNTSLADGAEVKIHVDAEPGSQIFGFEARLCRGGVEVNGESDFDPLVAGKCVSKPVSIKSDDYAYVPAAPPHQSMDVTWRAGIGTDTFTTDRGDQVTISCGPGSPCQVVLKLQYPKSDVLPGFAFRSFPLTYD